MAFRTQKISQMTPKGSDLEATDLIEVSTIESGSYVTRSITGQELIDAIPAPSVDWGDIGGTLSDQTDLNTALSGKVPTTRTLTINGTTQDLSADRTFTISTGITIGTTAITSGTVGRVLFEGTGNVVQESSSLFWDNTNARLGIGTSTPIRTLEVNGETILRNVLTISNAGDRGMLTWGGGYFSFAALGNQSIALQLTSGARPLVIPNATGNVLINTTTDAGFRLDVNGTARVQSNLNVGSSTFTSTATPNFISLGATYGDGTNFGTKIKLLDSGATQWGIGISSATGINYFGTNHHFYGSASTESIKLFPSASNSSTATPSYLDLGSSYSSTAGANPKLRLFGTSYAIGMSAGAVEYFAPKHVFYTGNVLINTTTDAGFRLDVNGTARINGDNTIIGFSSASQLSFRLGVVSNQGVSTRNGDFTIGLSSATAISGGRFNNNGTGYFWIDGYTEGASKAQNYPIIIGSRAAATGSSVGSYTTEENGSQTYFGFFAAQPSAQVIINSTTRGFLPPRMTTTQKNAIASPATGLMVYDTTLNLISVYNGTSWITL